MVDRTPEQLLGYLLGALEEPEREWVENQLRQDPEWQRELARARQTLQALWVAQPDFVPPPGLAARTCELVASYPRPSRNAPRGAPIQVERTDPTEAELIPVAAEEGGGQSSGWLDLIVAAGLMVAVALLIFPAIQNSRFNSRVAACQDRLRQMNVGLSQYSDRHDGFLPPVYDRGPCAGAGIYATVLVEWGFVDDPHLFVCPASPLAEDPTFHVPTFQQLMSATPEELARLREVFGGSYGYSLGYFVKPRVYSTRNRHSPSIIIAADTPSPLRAGYQSMNHDGLGQNVLSETGWVRFLRTPRLHPQEDDVFTNAHGWVAAGTNPGDSVVGGRMAVPCLYVRTGGPRRP